MSQFEYATVWLKRQHHHGLPQADEIVAGITVAGAIVEATGDSVKDALQMLADAIGENDEPFWGTEKSV